jgi:zinc-ribbon domain
MKREIPTERKALYYSGMIVTGIGALLFLSTFVSAILSFGNFDNFEENTRSMALRAFGGMGLILIGGILQRLGARGLAGSGLVLDPHQARKDLEPWSRMGGGVVQDALSEIDVVNQLEERAAQPAPQIKIRCQNCQALNDEAAKYCSQCGAPV